MKPVSNLCGSIFEERHHGVIGVSPFNSYFSEDRLRSLFAWAHHTFESFHVFVPDEATRYTLEASGYCEHSARKKSRRQARTLLNKIRRALTSACCDTDMSRVLTNAVLDENAAYRSLLARVEERFACDADFRRQALECSKWVLEARTQDPNEIDDAALFHAVRYFLLEMPLFMDSAAITGKTSSVFCYQQCPSILQALYRNRSHGLIAERQGFLIVDELPEPERIRQEA